MLYIIVSADINYQLDTFFPQSGAAEMAHETIFDYQ